MLLYYPPLPYNVIFSNHFFLMQLGGYARFLVDYEANVKNTINSLTEEFVEDSYHYDHWGQLLLSCEAYFNPSRLQLDALIEMDGNIADFIYLSITQLRHIVVIEEFDYRKL